MGDMKLAASSSPMTPQQVTPATADRSTRQAIVEAAHQLLVTRGNAGVKVRSVAQRVGVTTGALYGYFESREDLVSAAYAHALDRAIAAFLAVFVATPGNAWLMHSPADESYEALRARGRELWVAWLDAAQRARHDPNLARAIEPAQRGVIQVIAGRVVQEQQAGRIPEDLDPEALAVFTLAAALGLCAIRPLASNGDLAKGVGRVWASVTFISQPDGVPVDDDTTEFSSHEVASA